MGGAKTEGGVRCKRGGCKWTVTPNIGHKVKSEVSCHLVDWLSGSCHLHKYNSTSFNKIDNEDRHLIRIKNGKDTEIFINYISVLLAKQSSDYLT